MFGLDGPKFFLYLTKDTPYTRWPLWPGEGRDRPAGEPHGPYRTLYVNPAASAALTRGEPLPFGSLLVMENRAADKSLRNLAVRIKLKGYHPEAGDWYWFLFSPDGSLQAEGKPGTCIACHSGAKDRDFVMHGSVR
ncbi:MAG: cytochrome P460 family protein [Deltaproteobacteria bacterium]|nr:cytochrome P460 family protein [Deltaproteobacteria bacterium]